MSLSRTARLRDLVAEIEHFEIGRDPVMRRHSEDMREVLETEHVLSYALTQRGEGLQTEWVYKAKPAPRFRAAFDAFLADKTTVWAGLDPTSPEAWQRNVVVSHAELGLSKLGELPIKPLLRTSGVGPDDSLLRVLLCDGSSMIAWVGAIQSEPHDARQRAAFEQLIVPLQRRLAFERILAQKATLASTLDATLAAITSPAWVIDAGGRIVHANGLAMASVRSDRAGTRRMLAEHARSAAARRSTRGGYDVRRVSAAGTPARFLVVERKSVAASRDDRTREFATQAGFTRRQTDVLVELARGASNRAIAARLGVTERSIEQHLQRMFELTDTESRAELLARLLDQP